MPDTAEQVALEKVRQQIADSLPKMREDMAELDRFLPGASDRLLTVCNGLAEDSARLSVQALREKGMLVDWTPIHEAAVGKANFALLGVSGKMMMAKELEPFGIFRDHAGVRFDVDLFTHFALINTPEGS